MTWNETAKLMSHRLLQYLLDQRELGIGSVSHDEFPPLTYPVPNINVFVFSVYMGGNRTSPRGKAGGGNLCEIPLTE